MNTHSILLSHIEILSVVLVVELLTGCQTLDRVQYVVPAENRDQLLIVLESIARDHHMENRYSESKISKTIAYYQIGERNFTMLGAREYGGKYVVDLMFRSAGIGGKDFRLIKAVLETKLAGIYGSSLKIISNYDEMIPIPLNNNTTLQPTAEYGG